MKEILQEFTYLPTSSSILASKLKISLSVVLAPEATPTSSSPLLRLLVVGGVASVKYSMDRTLFVAYLLRLRRELGLMDGNLWKRRRYGLGSFLIKLARGCWKR